MSGAKEKNEERQSGNGTIHVNSICEFPFVNRWKGSFSVEAACIIPVVCLCLFMPMWIGIELYQETKQCALNMQETYDEDAVSLMYQRAWLEEFWKDMVGKESEN